jgi:hypothetical protein
MKNKLLFASMAAASILAAAATSSQAAPTAVSDASLNNITGMNGNLTTSSGLNIGVSMGGDNSANVQFGFYQWYDDHSNDQSTVKGGNRFDGSSSNVQAQVNESNNAIFWGGLGQNNLVTSGIGTGGSNMAYGTFAGGGF